MHVSKTKMFGFEISFFPAVLLRVSDLLVLCFDTYLMYLFCSEVIKKTLVEKPFNMVVGFHPDLLWGPDWRQKRCRLLHLAAGGGFWPIAHCPLKPGKLFALICIDLH